MIDLSQMRLEEKIGQMLGFAFFGKEFSEELRIQLEELKSGLVIFFKDNVGSMDQTTTLIQKINQTASIKPFIALDQEGGMVARVTEGIVQSPGAMAIAANGSTEEAYRIARAMGEELREMGFNFNFAPVADVNNNPLNPVINVRSYSDDPDVVARYVLAAANGYNDAGIMTSLKHFPGHGDTVVDSHVGLPTVAFDEDRLMNIELVPFIKAIQAKTPGIMSSHVRFLSVDPLYPASMSKRILTDLLRNKLGFTGLIVTDSLTMGAIHKNFSMDEIVLNAFNAGNDIMITCGARNIEDQRKFASTALRLVREGKIPMETIDRAVTRILNKKNELENFANPRLKKEKINEQNPHELARKISLGSITLIKDEKKLLPISSQERILLLFPILKVVTLADNLDGEPTSLSDYWHHPRLQKQYVPIDPSKEDEDRILAIQKEYDKIVYCSYNACLIRNQSALIDRLDKEKLIVIALRTPYDLTSFPNISTYLCSYEASPLAFESLSLVLSGQKSATGKLPVNLTYPKENSL